MSPHTKKDGIEQVLERWMSYIIRELSITVPQWDSDNLYRRAVALVVQTLLSKISDDKPQEPFAHAPNDLLALDEMTQEIGTMTPADVGEIYEYLRGFKVENISGDRLELVASVTSKRNQGLFYTPKVIINYIVRHTLDALDLREPSCYLDLRILDPAVGTGLFLAETLDQLTGRILEAMQSGDRVLINKVDNISKRIHAEIGGNWLDREQDKDIAIRIHVISKCLYGVDLDPVAVNIARAVLLEQALGQCHTRPEVELHLRVGNALMGEGPGDQCGSSKEDLDRRHATVYFSKRPIASHNICAWSKEKRIFHWPIEFPEVFEKDCSGFDAAIGNPPYEILSAKESGIQERRLEQVYLRRMFSTCKGKINTYRLMLERGLKLLRNGGILGFVVPATLLADSTADKLRRTILNETNVLKTVIIPEKARAFERVAQALLILVTIRGGQTRKIEPIFWKGTGPIPTRSRTEISRDLLEQTNFRVPIIKKAEDVAFLKALLQHPPLGGNKHFLPAGRVHQGEINLTVHKEFIAAQETSYPLIRGEHIKPLRLDHPCPTGDRFDWVLPKFLDWHAARKRSSQSSQSVTSESPSHRLRAAPWEHDRIAIGRVVNMDTYRRLKAVYVPAGAFLGDMTNYIADLTIPIRYLLGLLNSKVLNRRIKLTSTNNYLSAAEIEALPVPRIAGISSRESISQSSMKQFMRLVDAPADSIPSWVEKIARLHERPSEDEDAVSIPDLIELVVQAIQTDRSNDANRRGQIEDLWSLLDALVLKLYGVEAYMGIL